MSEMEPPTEHTRDGAPERARAALDRLIEGRRVRSVYQPIVDLGANGVVGYEALTRFDDDAGFAHAGELFDEALRHGRMWDLEMVTRRACLEHLPEWPNGVLLFMNCNPEVAADPRFAETFLALIEETGQIKPGRIVLEITERAETQHTAGLASQLRVLRAAGMQIAIDDLGAGVSGLQRIMELRPNWLKLDRELTSGIERDPYKQNLLDVLLRFTRVSGVRLVAEGVETLEQLGALLDLGVQHAQGYLISRPGDSLCAVPSPLAAWIGERRAQSEQRNRRPNLSFLASVMTECVSAADTARVADVITRLERSPDAAGVAAMREGMFVGWAPIDRIRRCALDGASDAPLSSIATDDATTAPATTLISEALLLLTSRRSSAAQSPILIEEGGELVGAVSANALLREASRLVADQEGNYTQISGLPGRVQCDRRLTTIANRTEPADALFIDIRGFHAYNERFGFELGDLILRILAGIVACAAGEGPGDFAGHLGDDRFLLVSTDRDADELAASIIREFEGATDRFVACADETGGDQASTGLRVVVLRRPAADCANASDMHRAAWRLRNLGGATLVGRSVLIDGVDPTTIEHVRLTA
jgi:EAL domain-containing protein (putative c-di-GMP-specific phosphodiesterase class I)/GGDEF domain-containing protein